uniref:Thioredoxin 2 n=1 Tax=Callorhinchus milii TaxID=7868 RepID=A0A4W3K6Q4_CALMI
SCTDGSEGAGEAVGVGGSNSQVTGLLSDQCIGSWFTHPLPAPGPSPLPSPLALPPSRTLTTSHPRCISFNIQDHEDFVERVINSKEPVLVDFHAVWCGPCKVLGPKLEKLVAKQSGKVLMAKVDIDDHTDLAIQYEVRCCQYNDPYLHPAPFASGGRHRALHRIHCKV